MELTGTVNGHFCATIDLKYPEIPAEMGIQQGSEIVFADGEKYCCYGNTNNSTVQKKNMFTGANAYILEGGRAAIFSEFP